MISTPPRPYLAALAYLLGRSAHNDQHVSFEKRSAMEAPVHEHGRLPHDRAPGVRWAMIVVQLAKTATSCLAELTILVARQFFRAGNLRREACVDAC